MIQVEGHPNLYRDEKTGAIINNDSSGYSAYMKQKSKKELEKEELNNMKKEISEIKEMLAKITAKLCCNIIRAKYVYSIGFWL